MTWSVGCEEGRLGCGGRQGSCCCCCGFGGVGIRAGATIEGWRTVKPFVFTRGRGCACVGSARGVVLGTNAVFWPGSTGVGGDCCSCGVFLPEPSSPDTSSKGVAAPLSLEIHSSSSSLPTVDAAMVKPALGFPPPRVGGGFVAVRRGATLGRCSRDCTRTVLPVRRTFVRVGGCKRRC